MVQSVALITGASQRLGLHMTRSLLAKGWQVVVFTRSGSPELEQLDQRNLTQINCNALDDESMDGAIQAVRAQFTRLDFILHNASIYEKDEQHKDDFMSFYDALYQIHMKLPARINTQLSDLLQTSEVQTNIIHVTDIYVDNPNPDYALYCSTKAASENLMISFAKRLAPSVRVNAIQPGPVKFLAGHSAEEQEKVLSETMLATEGGFEALEKAIYSILDNHYMTASVVRVDGGRLLC
ncbi:hypothetical protein CWE09_05340 [Aliidiomarina minuta]|uniref:Short-chain dehydrogenase n=1 Tax=Aliidiomarina minuta TaxID=880057 RepID=A0A432W7S7_9GAMM|nr:SDR family NAD(P)-dependent oxidoreductase [Aliidiomarina minuta]RUO26147.1 hypothetical protein CWE09_05340 [Aliidiomarina minuta]